MAVTKRRLGIDFGTSNTVAVLSGTDGRCRPLLFDGSPLLPSAVYASPSGMLVGLDAIHSARVQPDLYEPAPKRRIDDGVIMLGGTEHPVAEIIAAVLSRIRMEATRIAGHEQFDTTLTYPASWGPRRRGVLLQAASLAGLGEAAMVAEPVAAATYFTIGRTVPVAVGASVVVYDFGAGTFDVTVMRRADNGFDVLATDGLPDAGGLDVDDAIVAYLGATYGPGDQQNWLRLTRPQSADELRAHFQLWQDVRRAKEMLSRASTTQLYIPLLGVDAPLGREQLDHLARPVIDRTVNATISAIRAAGLPPGGASAIFLVGGASRMSLAATLLHRATGVAPTVLEQPELAVVEGSLLAAPTVPTPAAPSWARQDGPETYDEPTRVLPDPDGLPGPSAAPTVVPGASDFRQPAVAQSPGAAALDPGSTHQIAVPVGSGPPAEPATVVTAGESRTPTADAQAPSNRGRPQASTPLARRRRVAVLATVAAILLATVGVAIIVSRGSKDPADQRTSDSSGAVNSPGAAGHAATSPAACGYKIAFVGPLSGPIAGLGGDMKNAVTLAVDTYAAKHPGCAVSLVAIDSKGNATTAANLIGPIVNDDRILGVVGPLLSSEVTAVGESLNRGRLAMISPSATRANLNTGAWDVFHRTTPDDNAEGEAAGRVIQAVLRSRRVFVVNDNSAYGIGLAAKARQTLGGGVVGSATLTEGVPSVAAKIKTSRATAVFVGGPADKAGTLLKEMRARGITATMIGGDAINAEALVNAAGPANAEGTLLVCSCIDASGLDQSFVRSYQSRFGSPPGVYAGPAYDATTIFLTGLTAGVSDRAAMLRHVHQYRGDGVAGSYRFTSNGDLDPGVVRVWTFKVHDGHATPVGPAPRT